MLCVTSAGLTGVCGAEFIAPLRKLAVYGLAAHAPLIFMRCYAAGEAHVLGTGHIDTIVTKMSLVRKFGCGQGEPAIDIIALAKHLYTPHVKSVCEHLCLVKP